MLYVMTANHGPDTCPAVNATSRETALAGGPKMDEAMRNQGCTHHGTWVSRTGHVSFSVIDAPNAHAIENVAGGIGLATWNTMSIYPVVTVPEAMEQLAQM